MTGSSGSRCSPKCSCRCTTSWSSRCPRRRWTRLKAVVFDEMPAAMELDVTLKVDAKWGETWGDME